MTDFRPSRDSQASPGSGASPGSPWGDPVPAPSVARPSTRYASSGPARARTATKALVGGGSGDGISQVGPRIARLAREPGRMFRATRASLALLVISLGLGLALASAFGLVFWALASAIHHASS